MIKVEHDIMPWSRISVETVRKEVAPPAPNLYPVAKRALDLLLSLLLLVVLAPVMALIALVVSLDSPGPAIFKQERVGQGGRAFTMFKFRSMYTNCDETVHREFAKQYINGNVKDVKAVDGTVCFKPKDDARVTRIGKWLRKTSLDELPQLFNVLRGEMSLVGPRPAVRYEVEQYSRWQMQRLNALPGLTGLAQINGRSGLPFQKIAALDLEYIQRRSFWLDVWILIKTIPVVLIAKCSA